MAVDVRDGELAAWLAENREHLLRRWLGLVVERSSLGELAQRPFGERMRELDLLLDAARAEAGHPVPPRPATPAGGAPDALRSAVAGRSATGRPFAVALFAPRGGDGPPARAWARAIAFVTRPGEPAHDAGGGATAVLLDVTDTRDARIAAHGIRAGAFELLGGRCAVPEVGVAVHPEDGDLVETARARAGAAPPPTLAASERPAGDLWSELAAERERAAASDGVDERPPAPVTTLRPR